LKKILLALAAFVGVFTMALPAWAHVTVTAPGVTRGGGDQEITFRVPVEKNLDTVKLQVQLPTSTPIASVDVKPVPGWTHSEQTTKLSTPIKTDDGDITEAVTEITWTAEKGQGLKPGEYGDFTFIAGQLPDVASLTFPAIQTYSDGSTVKWIQRQTPGSEEPENPAPVLKLTSAAAAGPHQVTVQKSSNTAPTVLAIVALVVAAAALGIAVVGNARRKAGSG
jgi:periplasmic copper chaperone A